MTKPLTTSSYISISQDGYNAKNDWRASIVHKYLTSHLVPTAVKVNAIHITIHAKKTSQEPAIAPPAQDPIPEEQPVVLPSRVHSINSDHPISIDASAPKKPGLLTRIWQIFSNLFSCYSRVIHK